MADQVFNYKSTFTKFLNKVSIDDDDLLKQSFVSGIELSYWLATWLYDNDFDVNSESWDNLQLIKSYFPKLYDTVLYDIFNRNHDT